MTFDTLRFKRSWTSSHTTPPLQGCPQVTTLPSSKSAAQANAVQSILFTFFKRSWTSLLAQHLQLCWKLKPNFHSLTNKILQFSPPSMSKSLDLHLFAKTTNAGGGVCMVFCWGSNFTVDNFTVAALFPHLEDPQVATTSPSERAVKEEFLRWPMMSVTFLATFGLRHFC